MVGKSVILDDIAKFLIQGIIFIIPIIILVVYFRGFYLKKKENRTAAVNTGCIVVIGLIIGSIISHLFFEARPMFALGNVTHLMSYTNDSSFPSDHMLLCFGTAFGFYPLSKKLSFWLMGFGLIVGIAKIFAAQHYPLDILGTIILVLAISILYFTLISKWITKLYVAIEKKVLPKFTVRENSLNGQTKH